MDGNVGYGPSGSDEAKTKPKKSKRELSEVVTAVRKRLQAAFEHDEPNRNEAAIDLKFLAGDQWPDKIKQERTSSGRPMLTINQLPQFVHQVTNDIRQADFSIKVAPVDDGTDPELARVFDGIIKQIQYQSSAPDVFADACDHQAGCGIGHWRVCSEYTDDQAFDQEVRIKLIPNPLTVYYDPDAVEPDRSDMNWCIVTEMISKEAFRGRYPDASVSDVDQPAGNGGSIKWQAPEGVRIAEYWCRHPVKKTLVLTSDGKTQLLDDVTPGLTVLKTREVDTFEVEQYIVSGSEVLEGPFAWPGKWIPIIPIFGDEVPQESGAVVRKGMVRDARDPQALYNFNRTASAEALALQPKNPWLVTLKMIGEYMGLWKNANTANTPFLVYDPDPQAPNGPKREAPAALSPAFANEAMLAREDLSGTTGIYPAALGAQSNETSGVAIGRREKQGDTANYHYSAKLQRGLFHTGRVLIDVIPKFYDTQRVIRILGDDDAEEFVKINHPAMDQDGQPIIFNDLSTARFDVRVKIGPSFSTKREEAASFITEFLRVDPSAAPVVRDLLAKYSDMAGADEMAKRFKNILEGKGPLDDPEAPPQPPQPPPEVLKMQADQQMAEQKLQQDAAAQQQQIQLEVQKMQLQAQLEMEKLKAQIELEREKAAAQIELERYKADAQIDISRQNAAQDAQIKDFQARHSAELASKTAEAKAKANGHAESRATS